MKIPGKYVHSIDGWTIENPLFKKSFFYTGLKTIDKKKNRVIMIEFARRIMTNRFLARHDDDKESS